MGGLAVIRWVRFCRQRRRRSDRARAAVIARSGSDEAIHLSFCRLLDCFACARNDVGLYDHLWKMKNAPRAINPNPKA
jgi:hypothetical protein